MTQLQKLRALAPAFVIATLIASVAYQFAIAAPSSNTSNGAQLLEREGCLHCHYMLGKGGLIGPPFDGIEKFRTEDDIVNTLTNRRPLPPNYPKGAFDPRELMRHVRLDKATAREIAKYLVSAHSEESFEVKGHTVDGAKEDLPGGFTFVPHDPSEMSRKGLSAFKEGGCAACHQIGGIGGRRGPDLDGIGARLSKTTIQNRIRSGAIVFFDGKEYKPTEYSMPPAQLSAEQVSQITEFLLTLAPKSEKNR